MGSMATAELCDTNQRLIQSGEIRVLEPIFNMYGRNTTFCGPVVTLKVFEDNVLVREFLETKGQGRVLVIDGGGSKRCALVGGNLVQLAHNNDWAGMIVNGCVRDVDEISLTDFGVRALAAHPLKSSKRGVGERNVGVSVGGTVVWPGEWVYADSDGVLVSKGELCV